MKTQSYNYRNYSEMVSGLFNNGEVTGEIQSAERLEKTRNNMRVGDRIYRSMEVREGLTEMINALQCTYDWNIIAEGWCTDGAQSVPAIARLAELNPKIRLNIFLRDDNPEIMKAHQTNGANAIPKMFITMAGQDEVLANWGPRPRRIQDWVKMVKADPEKLEGKSFGTELLRMYATDKTSSLQDDFMIILGNLLRMEKESQAACIV